MIRRLKEYFNPLEFSRNPEKFIHKKCMKKWIQNEFIHKICMKNAMKPKCRIKY